MTSTTVQRLAPAAPDPDPPIFADLADRHGRPEVSGERVLPTDGTALLPTLIPREVAS